MARTPRPTFTSLVYGLYDGGYRAVVRVNGAVRAIGHAADRMEGEVLARRITRALKRELRTNATLPTGVVRVAATQ